MSLECSECERDMRAGHDPSCSQYEPEPGHTSAPPAPGIPSPSQTWPCTKCGGLHKLFEGCFAPPPAPAASQCCMGYPRCIPGEAHNPECPVYTAPCPHCPELCGASCRCDCHNPVPDIRRLLQEAKKEVDQWPQWMKDAPPAPEGAEHAKKFLNSRGLGDLSLYWPTNKPIPKIDYESGEAQPTLVGLMEVYAASRVQVLEKRLARLHIVSAKLNDLIERRGIFTRGQKYLEVEARAILDEWQAALTEDSND